MPSKGTDSDSDDLRSVRRDSTMNNRFTDRYRKVLQIANQEAQRFNHEYIGTEHILLGLVREGSGMAANVLKNLNIDLRRIRLEVEMIVQSGPEIVTMGKLPYTPWAKKVIEQAIEEAHDLNVCYVGTEHLFLGILRAEDAVAHQVLLNFGLSLELVRTKVLDLLGPEFTSSKRKADRTNQIARLAKTSWRTWNDGTVERLAQVINEEKRWGDLPILGDALIDAGCNDEEILSHCRHPGRHVNGCWVLDLFIEKRERKPFPLSWLFGNRNK